MFKAIGFAAFTFTLALFNITASYASGACPVFLEVKNIGNGCTDLHIDDVNIFTSFEGSCNQHDICYTSLGRTRPKCNSIFLKDMKISCRRKYDKQVFGRSVIIDPVSYGICRASAESYHSGLKNQPVLNIAKDNYINAQKNIANWASVEAENPSHQSCDFGVQLKGVMKGSLHDFNRSLYRALLFRNPTTAEATLSNVVPLTPRNIVKAVNVKKNAESSLLAGRTANINALYDEQEVFPWQEGDDLTETLISVLPISR